MIKLSKYLQTTELEKKTKYMEMKLRSIKTSKLTSVTLKKSGGDTRL